MAISFRHAVFLAVGLTLSACGGGTDPADMPFGTVQQLMANEVQPAADVYWGAVKFESLLVDGEVVERDIRPQNDEEWEVVRASAARLGEMGQVLLSPAYSDGRGDAWLDYAQGLTDVAALAEKAAIDQDPDAEFEVGGTIYNVCKACHQMYPPEDLPSGMTVDDIPADDNATE